MASLRCCFDSVLAVGAADGRRRGAGGAWSTCCAPSLNGCVCVCGALQSVFWADRQLVKQA